MELVDKESMIMKEKIKKFCFKGYHILCMVGIEVVLMLVALIDAVTDGTWQHILLVAMLYLPWILLFTREYHYHKTLIKMADLIKLKDLIRSIAADFLYDLNRYKKLYGELPPEEENQKPEESEK